MFVLPFVRVSVVNETEVIEICREAILVMLKIGGPIMLVGLAVGVIISLVQAVTQIQEMTLSFVPKVVVVFMMTLWMLPFMLGTLGHFTETLADRIVHMGAENKGL